MAHYRKKEISFHPLIPPPSSILFISLDLQKPFQKSFTFEAGRHPEMSSRRLEGTTSHQVSLLRNNSISIWRVIEGVMCSCALVRSTQINKLHSNMGTERKMSHGSRMSESLHGFITSSWVKWEKLNFFDYDEDDWVTRSREEALCQSMIWAFDFSLEILNVKLVCRMLLCLDNLKGNPYKSLIQPESIKVDTSDITSLRLPQVIEVSLRSN